MLYFLRQVSGRWSFFKGSLDSFSDVLSESWGDCPVGVGIVDNGPIFKDSLPDKFR